jgi:hypothetical protein
MDVDQSRNRFDVRHAATLDYAASGGPFAPARVERHLYHVSAPNNLRWSGPNKHIAASSCPAAVGDAPG